MLDGSNIKVYLRLRPIEGEERLIGNENVWQVHDGQAITLKATSEVTYCFGIISQMAMLMI